MTVSHMDSQNSFVGPDQPGGPGYEYGIYAPNRQSTSFKGINRNDLTDDKSELEIPDHYNTTAIDLAVSSRATKKKNKNISDEEREASQACCQKGACILY